MKINTSIMYNNYINNLNSNVEELLKNKEEYSKTKEYLLSKLEPYKNYINNYTNIDYNEIKDIIRMVSEKSLKHIIEVGIDITTIRRTINMIVTLNIDLIKIESSLNNIKTNSISKDLFKDIIYMFNDKLSDEIVYKGYLFRLGGHLGYIKIRKIDCRNRIKKRINWNLSNQKKEELLREGKLPYKVTERDENRKVVAHNNGENWFVYFNNDFDYLWYWNKGRGTAFNSGYYKFRPTRHNNISDTVTYKLGNVNKLKHLITSNSPLLNNFALS